MSCVRRYFYRVLPFLVNKIRIISANKLPMRNVYLTASLRAPMDCFGGSLASSSGRIWVCRLRKRVSSARGYRELKVCAVCVKVAEQDGVRPTSAPVNGIGKPASKARNSTVS